MLFKSLLAVTALAAAVNGQQYGEIPAPQNPLTPYQIRIAYNGPTSVAVGWNTFKQLGASLVKYGTSPDKMNSVARSKHSATYPTSRTWSNVVVLNDLQPNTKYYYQINSPNTTTYSFTTQRAAGDMTPFTAALVVDMGVFGPEGLSTQSTSPTGKSISDPLAIGEHTTIDTLVADAANYDFVLHPGDFSYADAWAKEITAGVINASSTQPQGAVYEALNEQFWQQLSAVSASKPYMVTAGNHEANCNNSKNETACPIGQRDFTGYISRFDYMLPASSYINVPMHKRGRFPNDANVDGMAKKRHALATRSNNNLAVPPFFYSFDYGMAHFILFDTETDFPNGILAPEAPGGSSGANDGPFGSYTNQQLDFIKQDLASVDRSKTPWVIAAGHRPYYTASEPCTTCQQAFEQVLYDNNVDVVTHGHVHNMELIPPIFNGQADPAGWTNPRAPAYVVNGAAGHWQGLDSLPSTLPNYISWAYDQHYGYSKLLFHSASELEIQFIKSGDGSVLKSQTLTKNHS